MNSDPNNAIWSLTPREAVAEQRRLAGEVRLQPLSFDFEVLAAADIGYVKTPEKRLGAVVCTFHWPSLEPLEDSRVAAPETFPYVPGLLSFREIPPLLEACKLLKYPPDVFLCDGQGLAHPRRLGLACHLGLCLGIPAVGCAKKKLCGEHEPLGSVRGSHVPLRLEGNVVGCVYRSRTNVKPLYISPGHLADVESSRRLVERCLGRYRIPEPQRRAHHLATELRNSMRDSARPSE
jgi:deoxyribonuclease V